MPRRPMIPQIIFDWAKRTPDRTAVIYNGRPWSYRSFAQAIAVARGYFARRGYVGPGYAVLAVYNLMDFWILSLALRSLGLTTVAVPSAAEVGKLGLPERALCHHQLRRGLARSGWHMHRAGPASAVSVAGWRICPGARSVRSATPVGRSYPADLGHDRHLQNGADESRLRRCFPTAQGGSNRHEPGYPALCVQLSGLDRGRLQVGGQPLDRGRRHRHRARARI